MDLSIIIVSWRVKDLLKKCLESVYNESPNLDFEVFVVDNASGDGTVEMIKKEFSSVNLIINKENFGFAKANNQAIRKAKGEFILLLNPDTEILDQAIEKAVRYMKDNEKVGIVGGRLYNPDLSPQPSVRGFPTFWSMFMIMLKLHHLFSQAKVLTKYLVSDFDYDREQEVDQIMGAFFMLRAELFKKIGLLNEHFFIWFEEVDFCKRVKELGYKIVYLPKCKVIHHFAQSFKQVMKVRNQEIFNRSLLYYFRKNKPFLEYLGLLLIYPISLFLAALIQIFSVNGFKKGSKYAV